MLQTISTAFPSLKILRCFALASFATLRLTAQSTSLPVSGQFLPGMDQVDTAVTTLMARYGSPGAQIAVTFNGRLVLARGYGYADTGTNSPVLPDSLFRIASLTKLTTAIATLVLVDQGKLNLDAKAFALLPQFTPLPGATSDPRLQNITVRQILHHTGGWDSGGTGYDPMFDTTAIAAATGTPPPSSTDAIIRYMLGRPLDFDPGTKYSYSNFGYCVLGRIIENISGQRYSDFVQANVLNKAGSSRFILGRTLLANRATGEVRYYDYAGASLANSVFPPTTATVPWPYGGFCLENMDSHGGWLANAIDYVRLFSALDGNLTPALLSAPSLAALTERPAAPVSVGDASYYGMGLLVRPITGTSPTGANWWHDGSLPGTETYAVRLSNGWSWAVFFNTRPVNSDAFDADIDSSINATLAVITPPATGDLFATTAPDFATQPISQSVAPGGGVTLAPGISSLNLPAYQWFKDGDAIAGATGPTLTIGNFSAGNVGAYSLVATNLAGSAATLPVVLQLASTDVGRLINLSCRAQTGTGANILIAGFVVGGANTAGSKQMLLRASGPALQQLGVTGTLPDPQLQLFDGGGKLLAANTGWAGSPQVIAVASAVAAFAWPSPSSADSALVLSQPSGNFTAQVAGANGDTGVSLVEVYDATSPGAYTPAAPRLINLSARAPVGTGGDVLIAGFVIGGSTPKTLLVRAIGPTLGQLGVPGTLSDAELEIYSGSTLVRSNDDWGGGLALSAAFSAVGAFPLVASSKDAALLVTLAPGAYTAQVRGAGGTTGVALVEIYEMP